MSNLLDKLLTNNNPEETMNGWRFGQFHLLATTKSVFNYICFFLLDLHQDHNAHGPEFHKHMYRINKQSGTKITVYHNFHDEVDVYRQHWWRCNGPCQKRPPYFGMVKRAMNRAPSERDLWWADHQQKCGGIYTKVKEPEDYGKKKRKLKDETESSKSTSGEGMAKIYNLWKTENTSDVPTKEKENNMQKSNVEIAVGIVPFSGKGLVLGNSKAESSTKTRPSLSNVRNTKDDKNVVLNLDHGFSSMNNNGATCLSNKAGGNNEMPKNKVHSKLKKKDHGGGNVGGLTIVDAFKRVEKAEKKPSVIIIDDSPAKPEISPSIYNLVPCPVCQTNIQENMINSHLDNCLF